MMSKFLYLKNKVISLIFKILPGMEGMKTYSWNEFVYFCIYIFTGLYGIYPSLIRRFDQRQGNVAAEFEMHSFTVGICSIK